MSEKTDIVKAWTDVDIENFEDTGNYLADDFESLDPDGTVVMDKNGWLGMGRMLQASFPDWKYVRTGLREEGDKVILTGHYEGTHQNDLDLSAMGMGVIPASGKKIVWEDTTAKVTLRGGKIRRVEPHGQSGGMKEFLQGLGVDMPAE